MLEANCISDFEIADCIHTEYFCHKVSYFFDKFPNTLFFCLCSFSWERKVTVKPNEMSLRMSKYAVWGGNINRTISSNDG